MKVIEIDESLFARVKHHRGKDLMRSQVWVFGMRERNSNYCVFYVVKNRTADELLPIIKKHSKPGSIIISDKWKAYQGIYTLGKGILI